MQYVFTCALFASGRLLVLHKQLKGANKKICSGNVDSDGVVLVIPNVQQLGEDKQWGGQKSLPIVGTKSNCFALFIHSQGAIKHPLSLAMQNNG